MFSLIEAAGWPIWFLILASVAALALILERSLALRRTKIVPSGVFDEVMGLHGSHALSPEMNARLAASSPLGRVLAAGIAHARFGRARMKEAMEDSGRLVAHELDRFLSAIGTIATVAPLLGLFGTVVGMIEIFGAQAPGGTNPQQLAHGISVALYNTALGILIAIPALIAYRHFRARVDAYLVEMEEMALRLADALAPDEPALGVQSMHAAGAAGHAGPVPAAPAPGAPAGQVAPAAAAQAEAGQRAATASMLAAAARKPVERLTARSAGPSRTGSAA